MSFLCSFTFPFLFLCVRVLFFEPSLSLLPCSEFSLVFNAAFFANGVLSSVILIVCGLFFPLGLYFLIDSAFVDIDPSLSAIRDAEHEAESAQEKKRWMEDDDERECCRRCDCYCCGCCDSTPDPSSTAGRRSKGNTWRLCDDDDIFEESTRQPLVAAQGDAI